MVLNMNCEGSCFPEGKGLALLVSLSADSTTVSLNANITKNRGHNHSHEKDYSQRHARPDRASPARGREWGRRADEVVGAPDAVPPLAPTMSLTPRGRRTLRSYTLIPPVETHTSCRHSRRARTGRPGYSLNPTPSKAPPTPLPPPWRSCETNVAYPSHLLYI